jgi:NitT/TauT family transport system permease protein
MAATVAASPSIEGRVEAPGRRRVALAYLAIVLGVVVVWEGAKAVGIASDLALPHIWTVFAAFVLPAQRNGPPLGLILTGQALFTFREALLGFAVGGVLGLLLGIGFVHSRLAERAFVPYVVASQTVPILAISPLIVVATKAGWLSVTIVSAYLTFFPVTIAALRGLRAADPRAFELMRSYASDRRQVLWKLRLPTAVPYLFPALRVAAASAVIGAIIGELPSGIPDGLGSALLNYNQYYTQGPERLWATIIMCSILGLAFVGLIRLLERFLTRGRYRPVEASA